MPSFETPGRVALDLTVPAGTVAISTWDDPRVDVDVTAMRGDDVSTRTAEETRIEADSAIAGASAICTWPPSMNP